MAPLVGGWLFPLIFHTSPETFEPLGLALFGCIVGGLFAVWVLFVVSCRLVSTRGSGGLVVLGR